MEGDEQVTLPRDTTFNMDRTPPQNIELEMSVLGAIMLEPKEGYPLAADILTRESFYLEGHALIFETMGDLHRRGIPPDSVAVLDALRREVAVDSQTEVKYHPLLNRVGGPGVVLGMLNSVPTAANLEWHARRVAEKGHLRQLIRACTRVIEDCYRQELPLPDILDRAESSILALASQSTSLDDEAVSIAEILGEYMDQLVQRSDEIQRRREAGETDINVAPGYSTGFANLEAFNFRLRPAELTIIAARPSKGKSALANNLASNIALKLDVPVVIFTMEMSARQVAERMLSSGSRATYPDGSGRWIGVPTTKLQNPDLSDGEWSVIQQSFQRLSRAPIFLYDRPELRPSDMRRITQRLMARVGRQLVVIVDYLQLMSAERESDSLYADITKISRANKALSQRYGIPVIGLSQFSREVEKQKRRPMLSDLRESGAIEQDADNVIFIHHPDQPAPAPPDLPTVELIIAKHRNGPIGTANMIWHAALTRFLDAAPEYRQNDPTGPPTGRTPQIRRTGNPI
jgi:replicative DNA helicase